MSQKYVQCGGTSETELKRPVPTASRGLVEKYATDVRMQSPCFLREWPGEGPFFVLINVDSNCVDVALKKKLKKEQEKHLLFTAKCLAFSTKRFFSSILFLNWRENRAETDAKARSHWALFCKYKLDLCGCFSPSFGCLQTGVCAVVEWSNSDFHSR